MNTLTRTADTPAAAPTRPEAALLPPVDVIEDATGITLYADLPGVPRDKLNLRVEGDQLTLEWGLGKSFGAVSAGLVGYSQWQTTNDSGAGASNSKAARHAVGAELGYPIPGAGVFLKGALYKEVSAKAGTGAQPKGSLLRFTLVKAF